MIQTKARHESSSTSAGIILACVFVSSALFGVGRASRLGHSVFIPLYSTCNCTSLPPPDRWLAVSMIKYDASVLLLKSIEYNIVRFDFYIHTRCYWYYMRRLMVCERPSQLWVVAAIGTVLSYRLLARMHVSGTLSVSSKYFSSYS